MLEYVMPSVELLTPIKGVMEHLEICARTAYQSGDKICPGSAQKLLHQILSLKHESVLEHFGATFRVICSRATANEIVRHRVGHSFTQESTRYVNYARRTPQVVIPTHLWDKDQTIWKAFMGESFGHYAWVQHRGSTPQEARGYLPLDTKTELVWTMNVRAARNMLKLRLAPSAHPDIRWVAQQILALWKADCPELFDDL